MKKIIKSVSALALASVASCVWAISVPLYQSPDAKSTVITQVEAGQRVIPIYRSHEQHGWIKVADPSNGKVGWLQMKHTRLRHATRAAASEAHAAPKAMAKKPKPVEKPKPVNKPKLVAKKKPVVKHKAVVKTKPVKPAAHAPVHHAAVKPALPHVLQAKKTDKPAVRPEGFVQRTVITTDDKGTKQYKVIEYSGSEQMSEQQVKQVIRNMERRNVQMQHDVQRMMNDMQNNFFDFQSVMAPPVEELIVVPAPAEKSKTAAPKPVEKTSFWKQLKNKVSN